LHGAHNLALFARFTVRRRLNLLIQQMTELLLDEGAL
jgi:hypothetical protein